MLLKEKDLEQFKEKVVIDCGYFKDDRDKTTMLGMTPCYNLGEGFYTDYKTEKKGISDYNEISPPFVVDTDRLIFIRELYDRALKNAYPIFVRFGDDFLFLNEFKFFETNQKVSNKMKNLIRLMDKNIREDNLVAGEAFSYKLRKEKKF